MADQDEDTIRPSSLSDADMDHDEELDDGTIDYRFLSTSILESKDPEYISPVIPRRGEKNFEPNSTDLQASRLAASRRAMHEALCHTRAHGLKSHVVGLYNGVRGTVKVRKVKGQAFKTVGRDLSGGGVELWPEEALWMLERGVLDVRWPVDDDEEDQEVDGTVKDRRGAGGEQGYVEDRVREQSADGVWMMERLVQLDMIELHGEMPNSVDRGKGINPVEKRKMDRLAEEREEQRKEENGIPMSLQGAYAAFLGEEAKRGGWLTLEKYLVYAGLKRAGFIVLRADAWTGDHTVVNAPHSDVTKMQNKEASRTSLFAWIFNILLASKPVDPHTIVERQRLGPLVTPGLYRSYNEIYRALHISPTPTPTTSPSPLHRTPPPSHLAQTPSFTTTFNIHKPHPTHRKSCPGAPSFRICVVSARSTAVPTLAQLISLLDEQPADSSKSAGMYSRIKHGSRNVVLAIVDEGVVSYMRVADAAEAFEGERLYERVGRPGRGGKGGGRGRGRGRGR